MKKILIGIAVLALSLPPALSAFATEYPPATPPNSGPGIKGEPGNKSGRAVEPPDQRAGTGASPGESGRSLRTPTQPSQDSAGVKGEPGNKSGRTVEPKSAN